MGIFTWSKLEMAPLRHSLVFLMIIASTYCRPPRQKVTEHHESKNPEVKQGSDHAPAGNGSEQWDLGIEYNRYLQEVVQVLESDPEFRKKLEDSDVEKIRDGSIAEELKFVDHNLRTKLDDVKRKEVDRLRKLAVKQYENNKGINREEMKMPGHIDVSNHRFDVEDLKKLIKTTTNDLEEADKKRREDFKKYEMEKKFEKEERLKHITDDEAREKEKQKMAELEKKHKDHEKLNHPMTKDQLEEVWEEQDHMAPEDWDPKTFFAMHDLNGDGFWEEDELKVLFQKELDKAYDPNAPEDDMKERAEGSERMREHVMKETDANKDRMISFDEFFDQTKKEEFNKHDETWDGVDDIDDDYSDEEFAQFEHERQAEIQAMLDKGQVPPGYPYFGEVPEGGAPYQLPQKVGSIPGQEAFDPKQPEGRPPITMHGSLPGQPAYLNNDAPNLVPAQQDSAPNKPVFQQQELNPGSGGGAKEGNQQPLMQQ